MRNLAEKLMIGVATLALGFASPSQGIAADESSLVAKNLERAAADYFSALAAGASTEELDAKFAHWTFVSTLYVRSVRPEEMKDPNCWLPTLETKRQNLPNPRTVLISKCFKLDITDVLTRAEYQR